MDSKKHGVVLMLVLSRKKDESVRIGSDIVITIIEIRGDKVRLGFAAPKDVSIHRQEVYEKIIQLAEEKIAS
jgi:carbon storage regulator